MEKQNFGNVLKEKRRGGKLLERGAVVGALNYC
jgi:hypothetical protein